MTIRTYRDDVDLAGWLRLRQRSFADRVAAGGSWTEVDFAREFQSKPWWSPERMWFACTASPSSLDATDRSLCSEQIVGSATLGRSGRPPNDFAIVSWLMIAPEVRRRGIARALLCALEAKAWADGERSLALETHASWTDAVHFYEACGYARRSV